MNRGPSLVFACGGSGGHIFPAVAVADELAMRRPDVSVTFVSSGRDIENEIFRSVAGRRVVGLGSHAAAGPLWHPLFLLRLVRDVRSAASFLKTEKPRAVVGFGGRGSFAAVAAARLCGVPTLIHEQNVKPGLANRLLALGTDAVATSFDQTRLAARRLRVTGNPIRHFIERDCRAEALAFFGFAADKVTLLVLGGSQGAESVNTLFLEAAPHLDEGIRRRIQVLHLCGRMAPAESEKRLAQSGVAARAFSFFDRMDLAYSAADVALGRAGATFLAEMEARRLPAILVPYPYAGAHQSANAQVVAGRTGARVAEQKTLTGERLAAMLSESLAAASPRGGSVPGPDPSRAKLTQFILETAGLNS